MKKNPNVKKPTRKVYLNIPNYSANTCKAYFDINIAKLHTNKGFEETITFVEVLPETVIITEAGLRKALKKVYSKGLVLLGTGDCDNAIIKALGL